MTGSVHQLYEKLDGVKSRLAHGGGGGNNSDMEQRISNLESDTATIKTDLVALKADVAVIKLNYATKHDVSQAVSDLTRWIIGTALACMAAFITVITFVLNNAAPKAPTTPAAQPAPIIIQIPAPPAPAKP